MSDAKSKEFYSTPEGQKIMMAESVGLPPGTYLSRPVRIIPGKDYGHDPLGNGLYRMVPSGDIVDEAERARRMAANRSSQ